MNTLHVLIVEDEEIAAKKLVKTLAAVAPEAQVAAIITSIRETVAWLETHPAPELILMDIELADGQRFRVFDLTEVRSTVIFTTSYNDYAIKAFKVNSIDYLLKPVQPEELRAALDKYQRIQALHRSQPADQQLVDISKLVSSLATLQAVAYRQRFLGQYMHKLVSVEVPHIAYFFSENGLTLLRTLDGRKMTLEYSLDEVQELVNPAHFFRVSRSFLVAAGSVQHIENYFGNRLALVLHPPIDKEVVVSREKLTPFKLWMGK